jgi:hypothetical protein
MKYITKPEPITVGQAAFGLEDLITYLVASDRRFNETGPGIRAGIRLEDAARSCGALPYVGPIQPEHFALLEQAAEEPSAGYPRAVLQAPNGQRAEQYLSRQLLPFLDAIREAKDEAPKLETGNGVSVEASC